VRLSTGKKAVPKGAVAEVSDLPFQEGHTPSERGAPKNKKRQEKRSDERARTGTASSKPNPILSSAEKSSGKTQW